MKTVLIDAINQEFKTIDIEDDLDVFYEIIKCRTIDIVNRKIGDRDYLIICDDEGLLKDNPILSAIDQKIQPMLVGNLLIVKNGFEGELEGLTDEDVEFIRGNCYKIPTKQHPCGHLMLHCEF